MFINNNHTKEENDRKMDFGKEKENETMQKEENEMDTLVPFISNLNHFLKPGIT